MADSELHFTQNPLVKVEGALTPGEASDAIVAGQNAPERLSFDPHHADYDAAWCRMVRDVQLNGEPVDDVIGFDIPRHVVYQLVRDAESGDPAFEHLGPAGMAPGSRLAYKRRELEGWVTVKYGLPVDAPKPDQRSARRG